MRTVNTVYQIQFKFDYEELKDWRKFEFSHSSSADYLSLNKAMKAMKTEKEILSSVKCHFRIVKIKTETTIFV